MLPEPWIWDEAEGGERVRRELAAQGWSRFHAPEMLALSERPSALAQQLFGWRPLRLHRQQITPDRENPVDRRYWRSKLEAKLHTDGPRFGIPPSALFMFCEHPPAEGGDVELLDLWPLIEQIRVAEPDLFQQLFHAPRHTRFAEASHWGPTVSLRRGHLVALHPSYEEQGDETGARFRAWVTKAEPVRFRPRAGDVYVINNHRCLHGRLAFEDLTRVFTRVMFWFVEPFACPPAFREAAEAASRELGARLAEAPPWIRRRFGVDIPPVRPEALARLRRALDLLADPDHTASVAPNELQEIAALQDILLSAALPALDEELPPWDDRMELSTRALRALQQAKVGPEDAGR